MSTSLTKREFNALTESINKRFGEYHNIFFDLNDREHCPVDVVVLPDTLVSFGACAYTMPNPCKFPDFSNAEFCIRFEDQRDVRDAKDLVQTVAKFSYENDDYLGLGHTVEFIEPISGFDGVCVSVVPEFGPKFLRQDKLSPKIRVGYYAIYPLFMEELIELRRLDIEDIVHFTVKHPELTWYNPDRPKVTDDIKNTRWLVNKYGRMWYLELEPYEG